MPRVLGRVHSAHSRVRSFSTFSQQSRPLKSASHEAVALQRHVVARASDTAEETPEPKVTEEPDEEMSEAEMQRWEDYFRTEDIIGLEICEELEPPPPAPPLVVRGQCYGCGIPLQASKPDDAGYVLPEKYIDKAKHRKQQKAFLCTRRVLPMQ